MDEYSDYNQEDAVIKESSKKRKKTPAEWKRNKTKIARLRGEEFTNYKGQQVPSKTTGESCR